MEEDQMSCSDRMGNFSCFESAVIIIIIHPLTTRVIGARISNVNAKINVEGFKWKCNINQQNECKKKKLCMCYLSTDRIQWIPKKPVGSYMHKFNVMNSLTNQDKTTNSTWRKKMSFTNLEYLTAEMRWQANQKASLLIINDAWISWSAFYSWNMNYMWTVCDLFAKCVRHEYSPIKTQLKGEGISTKHERSKKPTSCNQNWSEKHKLYHKLIWLKASNKTLAWK